ncbi:Serine carboxypeptidase-like 18 [Bienertia sinuspersici]
MAMSTPKRLLHFTIFLLSIATIFAGEVVDYLPGFPGKLPFNLQTGYIKVGDSEMFYYFVESEGNPNNDPLLLWLTGGPGCSSWNSLVYEIGPLEFDHDASLEGSLPQLRSYEYSWTKSASIIFLDSPVGTGFSYSTTQEGWPSSDTKAANEAYQFLMQWVAENPQYLKVPFFVGGDGYSGIIVPLITQLIIKGNEAGVQPHLNLKGYLVGSPNTDDFIDQNSKVEFAHRMALISDITYNNAKKHCKKNYIDVDLDNTQCVLALEDYERCVRGIWPNQILEPKCTLGRPQDDRWTRRSRSLEEDPNEFILSVSQDSNPWCRDFNYDTWANDEAVQDALHIRKGTVNKWSRCNQTISYTIDQPSVVQVHQNLTNYNLRLLVYSGDRDMVVTFVGVVQWIKSIKESVNLTLSDKWRPWFVDAQVAGYTRQYKKDSAYFLTYATVKGGGHTAAEYYRRECYEMFDRWVSYYPL